MYTIHGLMMITLLLVSPVRAENSARIFTEDFAPFGYIENGHLTGIGPDIVTAMSKALTARGAQIEVLPWKRAYITVLNEKNTALFSMSRIKEREDLFKWVGPLYSMQSYLFGYKDYSLKLNSLNDARKVESLLVQDGGATETQLLALGFNNLVAMNNIDKQVAMLTAKRVELIEATDVAVAYQLQKLGLPLSEVKPVLKLNRADFYLAFSRNTDDEVIEKWRNALKLIHENGTWRQITAKYLPNFDLWQ